MKLGPKVTATFPSVWKTFSNNVGDCVTFTPEGMAYTSGSSSGSSTGSVGSSGGCRGSCGGSCVGGCGGSLVRTVRLARRPPPAKLGFSLRGGREHGTGFFVTAVEPSSEAYHNGLM
ncbi:unnamed protein product, partial [Nesidiocoris tenuis]